MKPLGRTIAALMLGFLASLTSIADQANSQDRPATAKAEPEQEEAVKIGTALVTVPVLVSDRDGRYVPDMRKEEFTIFEDGVQQEIAFFAAIEESFHVVLMIDTSASTEEKLVLIRRAARTFVQQLKPDDRVKVVSFDDEVRDLNEFTSDRSALDRAIESTRSGKGTKLYDAVRFAIGSLSKIRGRKAIVLFTDGVDWHSDEATYDETIDRLQEAGVIVYPILYDTRAETEALVRQQQRSGETIDLGDVLRGPPRGTTPPTVPGGRPLPAPGDTRPPWERSLPPIIISRGPGESPPSGGNPGRRPPGDDRFPPGPGPTPGDDRFPPRGRNDDGIGVMLDNYYRVAGQYLRSLAETSGGRLYLADTLSALPLAFEQIAAELRSQYSLGYYPANAQRDGSYRKIKVKVSRKKVVIRARPGYKAPETNERDG